MHRDEQAAGESAPICERRVVVGCEEHAARRRQIGIAVPATTRTGRRAIPRQALPLRAAPESVLLTRHARLPFPSRMLRLPITPPGRTEQRAYWAGETTASARPRPRWSRRRATGHRCGSAGGTARTDAVDHLGLLESVHRVRVLRRKNLRRQGQPPSAQGSQVRIMRPKLAERLSSSGVRRGAAIWDAACMTLLSWFRKGTDRREEHGQQLELLLRELERHLASQDRRISTAESRSGVLIASSAIFAGLLVVTPMTHAILVALVVNIAAAGFGIATIFPRSIEELKPSRVRARILAADSDRASLYLADQYMALIERREAWISLRMRLVSAGLGTLGASLLLAAFAISESLGGR